MALIGSDGSLSLILWQPIQRIRTQRRQKSSIRFISMVSMKNMTRIMLHIICRGGALLQEKKNKKELHVMVEDVPVEKNGIILRNLVKAQHLD